jgi:hypothetical protein
MIMRGQQLSVLKSNNSPFEAAVIKRTDIFRTEDKQSLNLLVDSCIIVINLCFIFETSSTVWTGSPVLLYFISTHRTDECFLFTLPSKYKKNKDQTKEGQSSQ